MQDVTYQDIIRYSIYSRERSRVNDWTFRVILESMCYEQNCVLTLTYNDENLPQDGSLDVRDFQLFMKSLRKHIAPIKVRYFGCGEYGSKGMRPHFHVILFGYCPDDLIFMYKDKGNEYCQSPLISRIWNRGYILVCPSIDSRTVPYVSKYLQKFNEDSFIRHTFDGKEYKLRPPFVLCSRRPGIGANALDSAFMDFDNDKLYVNGKSIRIPRFYLKALKKRQQEKEFYFDDFDGSLVFSSDLSPAERDFMQPDTPVDRLLEKRRQYWYDRSDHGAYMTSVRSFKRYLSKKVVKKT